MKHHNNFFTNNNGQSMMEFIIVFPVLFIFILSIIQISIFYVAKQMVKYAAYNAARSAIVWIPEENVSSDKKIAQIKKAATISCMAISPISSGLTTFHENKALILLGSIVGSHDLLKKYHSANQLVFITILDSNGQRFPIHQPYDNQFTHQDITVEIVYFCPILIPVIDKIFSSLWKNVTMNNRLIYALPIRGQCTLPLEGNVKHDKQCG